eukprot:GEZU01014123.1.p1 GENE.GEZU01014123.1~~GEZU01014123.1.p1  ORF type:complete len:327 (+),score=111.06 GEZU01014123.1:75-1055(+)
MLLKLARALGLGCPILMEVFLFNIIQVLTFPLSKIFVKPIIRLNCWMAGTVWRNFQYIFEPIDGIEMVYSGDKLPDRENAIVFSNHRSFTDFMMLHSLAQRKNMQNNCKYFAKDSLKYIPGFGWGIYLMGMIMIKRDWLRDQKRIEAAFANIKQNRVPVWLISFLEGSRLTQKKLEKSQEYAKKKDLPVFQNVLLPRTKGFIATVGALRGSHVKYVYDLTLGYGKDVPTIWNILSRSYKGRKLHIHVRRFAIADLPTSDDELAKWCYARFKEKDELLTNLNKTGSFDKSTEYKEHHNLYGPSIIGLAAVTVLFWAFAARFVLCLFF